MPPHTETQLRVRGVRSTETDKSVNVKKCKHVALYTQTNCNFLIFSRQKNMSFERFDAADSIGATLDQKYRPQSTLNTYRKLRAGGGRVTVVTTSQKVKIGPPQGQKIKSFKNRKIGKISHFQCPAKKKSEKYGNFDM